MELKDFLEYMNSGKTVIGGSEVHRFMHELSQEALKLTAKLNNTYRTAEEIRDIFSQLTGKQVDDTLAVFLRFIRTAEKI
ncbi:MAG: hypothetical protein LUG95_02855 [Clostridiales bacterium]|nr:hypothetical protein [Clostridiales bacterium]